MKGLLGLLTIGSAFTAIGALQWGSTGAIAGATTTAVAAMLFGALVVYGRQRLNEASRLVDMP